MECWRRDGPESWLALAVAAASIAGILALGVTAARLPVLAGRLPPEVFSKALVGHVTFSLVVWLTSCSVAVALHRSAASPPGSSAALSSTGVLAMLAGLVSPGRPVVVDYLPYVDSPAYLLGYALFALGTLTALRSVRSSRAGAGPRCLATAFAATCAALLAGLARAGESPQAALWGAGHALQLVYVSALALSWYQLAADATEGPLSSLAFRLAAALSWVPALLYLFPNAVQIPRSQITNAALGFALSVPTVLHLWVLAPAVLRAKPGLGATALRWSVALYLLGGLLAPVGVGNTLRVTAHYHAMLVGGVTTAFMGALYGILDHREVPVAETAARWQVHLFAAGVVFTVAALLVAAGYGLPRKAYLGAGHPWQLPFALLTFAAALSTVGGAWFLASAGWALFGPRCRPAGSALPVPSPGR